MKSFPQEKSQVGAEQKSSKDSSLKKKENNINSIRLVNIWTQGSSFYPDINIHKIIKESIFLDASASKLKGYRLNRNS